METFNVGDKVDTVVYPGVKFIGTVKEVCFQDNNPEFISYLVEDDKGERAYCLPILMKLIKED